MVSFEPTLAHLFSQSKRRAVSAERHCNRPIGCAGAEFYISSGADVDFDEDRHDVPVSERKTTWIQWLFSRDYSIVSHAGMVPSLRVADLTR